MGVCTLLSGAGRPLILLLPRMATSKLFVDSDYLEKAEKDDWAKCVCRIVLESSVN